MSAFMVNDGTIDRAVSAMIAFGETAVITRVTTADMPPPLQDQRSLDHLGAELIKLNMEALRQRYGDRPLPFTYVHREHTDPDPLLARLRAVACLTYQCSEGDVPSKPLYKLLEVVEDDLAHQCARKHNTIANKVRHLAAYQALPWDFDD